MHGSMRRAITLALTILLTGCSLPRWPADGTVTSPFGLRRDGLGLAIHHGVDISLPPGTAVRAMAPGRVVFAGAMTGYGRAVILDHGDHVRTLYAHLSDIRVEAGQRVDGRSVIGLSGSSGRTSGPHLHFEIRRRGRAEDPVALLGGFPPPARPAGAESPDR